MPKSSNLWDINLILFIVLTKCYIRTCLSWLEKYVGLTFGLQKLHKVFKALIVTCEGMDKILIWDRGKIDIKDFIPTISFRGISVELFLLLKTLFEKTVKPSGWEIAINLCTILFRLTK